MPSNPTDAQPLPDTVERAITIEAPIETVWGLAHIPGWWVNSGEVVDHDITWDGEIAVVATEFGDMRIELVEERDPTYVSFRWLGGTSGDAEPLPTLVEFFLTEVGEGTELRVVESGWSTFEPTEYVRHNYAENTSGWEKELAAARTHLVA